MGTPPCFFPHTLFFFLNLISVNICLYEFGLLCVETQVDLFGPRRSFIDFISSDGIALACILICLDIFQFLIFKL